MSIESRSQQYGSIFGQWHIEKLLGTGSGGKSAVFSIYRDNEGWMEHSALKVVCLIQEYGSHEELSARRRDEYSTAVREQRAQADQEVRLMDQLRGKTNIVDYQDHAFHSWHDDNGFGVDLLIRMEKLTDLRSRIRRGELFSQAEILRVGRDICRALVVCHGKSIIHRDIKPENIFFNRDGDYKLGDFGISRILDNTQGGVASTGIGTLPYLPWEQASGRYDERVDIYSLGMVLYELANGNRLPFAESSYVREEHIRRRLAGEPLPPLTGVCRDLAEVIMTACAFRPEDRFQSAQAMLRALESVVLGPASAVQSNVAPRAVPTAPISSLGAVPTQSGTTPRGSYGYPANASKQQNSLNGGSGFAGTGTKTRNFRKPLILLLSALAVAAAVLVAVLLMRNAEGGKPAEDTEPGGQMQTQPYETNDREDTATSEDITMPPAQTEAPAPVETEPPAPVETEPPAPVETEPPAPTETEPPKEPVKKWNTKTILQASGLIGTGGRHTVIRMPDGTAIASGDNTKGQCNVSGWTDLLMVAAGDFYSLGLKSDGTVVSTGDNSLGQCNVYGWTDIEFIACGDEHAVGLKSDGTVVTAGKNDRGQSDAAQLNNYAPGEQIIAIAAGWEHTVALYSDGRVYAIGSNRQGQLNVTHWENVVAVFAGANFTVALFEDGSVDAVGDAVHNLLAVDDWEEVMMLASGDYFNVAYTRDGEFLATGLNDRGQCNVYGWGKIIALSAGHAHTVAITEDGRILATGDNSYGQLNVSNYPYK